MPLRPALIALFALIAASQCAVAAGEPSSIRLIHGKNSALYLVEGTLNDKTQVLFLLDTGATETAISDGFARGRKLKVRNKSGASGRYVQGATLAFGLEAKKSPKDIPVVKFPPSLRSLKIAGVLSPQDHFAGRPFTIDFPGLELRAHPGSDVVQFGTEAEIKTLGPCPDHPKRLLVTAYVNNLEGKFYLDSGSRRSSVTSEFSKKLRAADPSLREKARQLKNVPMRFGSFDGRFPIDVLTSKLGCAGADGKIGIDVLKRFRLAFSADLTSVQLTR